MRKLVNGKIVDIQNIELFEKAAEGMAIGRTLSNVIPNESLDLNFDIVEKYIEAYKSSILLYHSHCMGWTLT